MVIHVGVVAGRQKDRVGDKGAMAAVAWQASQAMWTRAGRRGAE
jgi:hypothetical protein